MSKHRIRHRSLREGDRWYVTADEGDRIFREKGMDVDGLCSGLPKKTGEFLKGMLDTAILADRYLKGTDTLGKTFDILSAAKRNGGEQAVNAILRELEQSRNVDQDLQRFREIVAGAHETNRLLKEDGR